MRCRVFRRVDEVAYGIVGETAAAASTGSIAHCCATASPRGRVDRLRRAVAVTPLLFSSKG
jgi:hypothetical protein